MDKYYTPDISEFHVGFEYFVKSKIPNYTSELFLPNTSLRVILDRISKNQIWVKNLDREDIESFGFKFYKKHAGMETMEFEMPDYNLYFDPDFKGKHYVRIDDGNTLDYVVNYFSGTIKNKSELKRVLTQIGVIDE